jgi:carbamoyl-phosphate synthase large subunit
MPKNTHINSILVIGSGPIKIGQACEFDYSGTQALKALREEGYRIILINSNPATIMTDADLADATYIEPITPAFVKAIIEQEKPDALIATLGGQTALNCALALHEQGVLLQHKIQLLGASIASIQLAEDRQLFHQAMQKIGLDVPKSHVAHNLEDALRALATLGLPIVARSSFSLGGLGSGVLKTEKEAALFFEQYFATHPDQSLTLDEGLIGWKEFELEVVRDQKDNCIVVCGVENVDPLGIHTGDSITVAPIQTLTDPEYQKMRNAAFAVLRTIGIETGGSNVQFAINPKDGRMVIIEMNPRVSRSSALVSKATGFPIAKIAAKLAIGYTLDELQNEITEGQLPASFEPSIDYIITKIPQFHDEKFQTSHLPLGTKMRSVGEVMGIGSTFLESLHYAMESLDISKTSLREIQTLSDEALIEKIKNYPSNMLWVVAEGFRRKFSLEDLHALTLIDPWFLSQLEQLVQMEKAVLGKTLADIDKGTFLHLKKNGFSDKAIAKLLPTSEQAVRAHRLGLNQRPVYKSIDSCAGEFKTATAYLYQTYQDHCEAKVTLHKKVMVLGSGPNRIGQGIEFDYVCVKAIRAFAKAGYETIMVNCNPETVSTDYDVADKLYFIPITYERILDLIEKEKPDLIALQFGGQTPLNLLSQLEKENVPLVGLNEDIVSITEDRAKFRDFIKSLNLEQPTNHILHSLHELENILPLLHFPVIVRPSFILGGKGMEIISNEHRLKEKLASLLQSNASNAHSVLIEEFLQNAIEVDVDAISDGEGVFIPTLLEHIEAAGIHSGDSACITPPYQLTQAMIQVIHQQTKCLIKALKIKGLVNIQFAICGSKVYVIEVNPRASRTLPFICKATGLPLVDIAVHCMLGQTLAAQHCLSPVTLPYYYVKEAVFPFQNFSNTSAQLGPEMKATGEVMGIGRTPEEAFLKAQMAVGYANGVSLSSTKKIFISGLSEEQRLFTTLQQAGFFLTSEFKDKEKDRDRDQLPDLMLILDNDPTYLSLAIQHNIPYVSTLEAANMMVNSLIASHHYSDAIFLQPIQKQHKKIKHPSKTKHLLTGMELTSQDILEILTLAAAIKKDPKPYAHALEGKNLVMLFEKPSFRTRLSFHLAIESLGGVAIESVGSTRKTEAPKDSIRVLNGYCDFIMVRTHDDNDLKEMATHATVPIINGLSALYHPCQALADLLSLQECFGTLQGLTLTYIGDGNNVLHNLLLMAPKVGVAIRYSCPKGHEPDTEVLVNAKQASASPEMITSYTTPEDAVKDAHAVYTDVWVSMGFENENRNKDDDCHSHFQNFQVNEQLMSKARADAVFMHCMPMERGKEVSTSLPDEPCSIIFSQSENRLHVQKAVLIYLTQVN